ETISGITQVTVLYSMSSSNGSRLFFTNQERLDSVPSDLVSFEILNKITKVIGKNVLRTAS
ncbi:10126_t:CDS:1, partial [Acaulospora colombiana]